MMGPGFFAAALAPQLTRIVVVLAAVFIAVGVGLGRLHLSAAHEMSAGLTHHRLKAII
jgi:preprotein translocase subunit SecG